METEPIDPDPSLVNVQGEGDGEGEEAAAGAAMDAEPNGGSVEAHGEGDCAANDATMEDEASGDGGDEVASNVSIPSSLEQLLQALADGNNLAEAGYMAFGRVELPERELRTPAIKAYKAAGGSVELDKTRPFPGGFHVLQVRALLALLRPPPCLSATSENSSARVSHRLPRVWANSCVKTCLPLPS